MSSFELPEPDYFERTHHGSFWRRRGDQPLLYRCRLRTLRRRAPGRVLLDVGSGEGFFAAAALRAGFDAFGVDYLPEGVQRTAARIGARRTAYASGTQLPFQPETFHAVTAWDVLEHIPQPADAVRELRRVLRRGGVLAFSTPNPDALSVRCRGRGSIQFSDDTHVSILRAAEWSDMLRHHAFRVEMIGGDSWWDPPYVPTWVPRRVWTGTAQLMMALRFAWPVSSGENTVVLARAV